MTDQPDTSEAALRRWCEPQTERRLTQRRVAPTPAPPAVVRLPQIQTTLPQSVENAVIEVAAQAVRDLHDQIVEVGGDPAAYRVEFGWAEGEQNLTTLVATAVPIPPEERP